MAGGNMKIGVGGYGIDTDRGQRVFAKDIDAHDKKAGDFTEPVTINGKSAFLTKAGKEALNKLEEMGGFRFSVETEFFSKAQEYSGSTK